jgi:hypothetical protein
MNRRQNLQIRLAGIAMKIDTSAALDEGERIWLGDLLMLIGRGEDIRDVAGFRVQKGGTVSEKPFWVSAHYRALRALKVSKVNAMKEIMQTWDLAESTAADYIAENVLNPKEFVSVAGWSAEKIIAFARWRAKCETVK